MSTLCTPVFFQGCLTNDIMPEYDACQSYIGTQSNGGNFRWVLRQKYQCSAYCADAKKQSPDLVSVNFADGTKCSREKNYYCINGKCSVSFYKFDREQATFFFNFSSKSLQHIVTMLFYFNTSSVIGMLFYFNTSSVIGFKR